MIYINRNRISAPSILDMNVSTSPAFKERVRAITFFDNKENAQGDFDFSIYGKPEVRDALRRLFFDKCAYCESKVSHTHSIEVEHYRPKKAILLNNKLDYPGYYWLAADWNNLLPSCINCNQIRNHLQDDGNMVSGGKGNKFPLLDESKRMRRYSEEDNEEPLLINPCLHNPEDHLIFSKNGMVDFKSKVGERSIEIYALMRKRLRRIRREHAAHIRFEMYVTRNILRILQISNHSEQIELCLIVFHATVERLKKRMHSSEPYAALSRQIIRPFLMGLRDELNAKPISVIES